MHQLEINLLGGFNVIKNGRSTPTFHTQKARALFAYLALHPNQPISRNRLAGLLWPDSPPARAKQNLRQALTFLRRDLQEITTSPLTITRQHITFQLNPTILLDTHQFQTYLTSNNTDSLNQATALYQGALLTGFFVAAPEYETWLLTEREKFQTNALTTLAQLADHHLARGDYAQAKQNLSQALTIDAWHETAHRSLMRAHALTGDTAAALAQYEKCRTALLDGLGVEPLPATQALYAQIRDGRFTTPIQQIANERPLPPFVGRQKEHAQLTAIFTKPPSGNTAPLTLIEGEMGSGKTRLAEEFIRFAQSQNIQILPSRCFEFGETVPYQPIVELLRTQLQLNPEPNLSPTWLAQLTRLLPELHDHFPNLPTLPTATGEAGRQRLFTAVSQLLTPTSPTLIFLDDLHWADQPSLDLLHFLIRQNPANLRLLVTFRPEESGQQHPLTTLKRQLSRDHLTQTITLNPLDQNDIHTIAQQLLNTEPPTNFIHFLQRESEGNAFILTELLNSLYEQEYLQSTPSGWQLTPNWEKQANELATISTSLKDSILNRVERLPPTDHQLLQLAAVIGQRFDAPLLQAVANLDQLPTPLLKTWQQNHLIRPSKEAYDFAHDKIREVIYNELPPAERQNWHQRIAQTILRLDDEANTTTVTAAPTIAHHFRHSAAPQQAIPHLLTAAQNAEQLLAFTTCVDYCTQALNLHPSDLNLQFQFLRLRQAAYEYLGQPNLEEADALEMLALAKRANDVPLTAVSQQRLAIFYMHRNPPQARYLIQETLPLFDQLDTPKEHVQALLVAAILQRNNGQNATALDLFHQSRNLAKKIGDAQSEGFALGYIAFEQIRLGQFHHAAENYELGKQRLQAVSDLSVELGYHLIGTANLYRIIGQYDHAITAANEVVQIGTTLEHTGIQCWGQHHLAKIALWQQDYAAAQLHYTFAQTLAEEHRYQILQGHVHWGYGAIHLAQQNYPAALKAFTTALSKFDNSHKEMTAVSQAYLGVVQLKLGNKKEALSLTQTAVSTLQAHDYKIVEGQQIILHHIQALQENGCLDEAKEWLENGRFLLHTQAQTLPPQWQHPFLHHIPHNHQLLTL